LKYVCDIVVRMFTFAISSFDELLSVMSIMLQHDHSCTKLSKLSVMRVSDRCRPTYTTISVKSKDPGLSK